MNYWKKSTLIVFIFIITVVFNSLLIAQETLVPYRIDNAFGLSDLEGNLKLDAQFKEIQPIGKNFFAYEKEDSQSSQTTTGVLHNTQSIISDKNHQSYTVVEDHIIVGSDNNYSLKNAMIYNLKGKALYSKPIATFQSWNPIVRANCKEEKYECIKELINFVSYEDQTFELSVVDLDKVVVKERWLENVRKLKIIEGDFQSDELKIEYINAQNNYQQKYLYQLNGSYVLSDTSPKKISPTENLNNTGSSLYSRSPSVSTTQRPREAPLISKTPPKAASIPKEKNENKETQNTFVLQNDTLKINGNIFPNKKNYTFESVKGSKPQKSPIIYTNKKGEKGLIYSENQISAPKYTHLSYLNSTSQIWKNGKRLQLLYAGVKEKGGKVLYGIIDDQENEKIPFLYDSIQIWIETSYHISTDSKSEYKIYFPNEYQNENNTYKNYQDESRYSSDFLVAYQNGKCGLIGFNQKIYLPIAYDNVFMNEVGIYKNNSLKTEMDFIITRNNNQYGIVEFNYNGEITKRVEPIFPAIPTLYYPNYNGIKGLNIYVLSTHKEFIYCYAHENGKVYLKQ